MKKKLVSLFLALMMAVSAVPLPVNAASLPMPGAVTLEDPAPPENPDTPEIPGGGGAPSEPDTLLKKNPLTVVHPLHLNSGTVDLNNAISGNAIPTNANDPASSRLLSFEKGDPITTGSVKVSTWDVSASGELTFTLHSGKQDDTVTFPVTVNSSRYGSAVLNVVLTLGYENIMVTNGTTVTYGQTMKLTCAGLIGTGAVIWTVANDTGSATISGDVLTATRAGNVTVTATQVMDGTNPTRTSDPVTITIEQATPTGRPSCTVLDHAGHTLGEVELRLNFSVPGHVEWVLGDNTEVIANTEYEWRFTPDDSHNYKTITGTLMPYVVDYEFALPGGTTTLNSDGSYTTVYFADDDTTYRLTEFPDGRLLLIHILKDGTVITTEETADGTHTITTEKKDGSKQITCSHESGVTYTTTKDKYGYTTVQVYIPSSLASTAVRKGTVIELPMPEIPCTDDWKNAPVITFSLRTKSPVRVSIPVRSPRGGTVAATIDKNGQETIMTYSTTAKDALLITLAGSAKVKVYDNSHSFSDVDDRDWFKGAVDFVSSRGLFQGIDHLHFAPDTTMSRAMLVTVLFNLEGRPYGYHGWGSTYLTDVEDTWYETQARWAVSRGILSGFPGGTFQGDLPITREQLAVILYRYAGYPSVTEYVNTSITDYLDYKDISSYAYNAMYWAACSGVLYTSGRDLLAPQRAATRAEVAQTMQNLVIFLTR